MLFGGDTSNSLLINHHGLGAFQNWRPNATTCEDLSIKDMITVKTYTDEVRGKPDGNSDWFTTDNSKAMPPGRVCTTVIISRYHLETCLGTYSRSNNFIY